MASEKMTYELTLRTSATGKGAAETKAGLEGVDAAAKKIPASGSAAAGSINQIQQELKEMQNELRNLPVGGEQFVMLADKVALAETKLVQAELQARKVTNTSAAMGSKFQQVGYQAGDFAVQIASGGNAMTAFTQQGTQLLGAFGPYGAIAGALLAIGGAVYKGMTAAEESTGDLNEKVQASIEKLNELAKTTGGREFDEFIGKLALMSAQQELINEGTMRQIELAGEQANAQKAIADAQMDLMKSAVEYLGTIDATFNKEEALLALRKQSLENEKNFQIAAAKRDESKERAAYTKITDKRPEVEEEKGMLEAKLTELEEKQKQLFTQLTDNQKWDQKDVESGLQDKGYKSAKTVGTEAEIKELEPQIEGVMKALDDIPVRLKAITEAAYAQGAKVDQAVRETEIKINEINATFDAKGKAEKITAAADLAKQGAQEIAEKIEDFKAIGPVQEKAKADIMKAVEDGKLTAAESQSVSQNLSILLGTLKQGQGGQISLVKEMIEMSKDIYSSQIMAEAEVKALRSDINALKSRMGQIDGNTQ